MALGGFQESIGHISKIPKQRITRQMDIYLAVVSVHELTYCSSSEGHSAFLSPLVSKTILYHRLPRRHTVKQEDVVTWLLQT